MKGRNLVLAFLGAEFMALFRVLPGRMTALAVFASLIVKEFVCQYVPIPPAYGALLHIATMLATLSLLLSLLTRKAACDGGTPGLALFGASRQRIYLVAEPVLAAALALALILPHVPLPDRRSRMEKLTEENLPVPRNLIPSPPRLEPGFAPWWRELDLIETDVPLLPLATNADRAESGVVCLLIAWLGFLLHARTCDWPQSGEYRALKRREREERDAASGRLTFYSVGEPDDG